MNINGIKMASEFRRSNDYLLPVRKLNEAGQQRKVGIEIEFAGLSDKQAATVAQDHIGGFLYDVQPHTTILKDTDVGDIEFMLDTKFAHPNSKDEAEAVQDAREVLGNIVSGLVPYEMVTDPFPIDQLHLIDTVAKALSAAGAKGTQESIAYAFGLHINAEIASGAPDYLLSIIRAMILLDDQVRESIHPDWSRDVMQWAQSYQEPYELHVMSQNYNPDFSTLIRDYIELNPGRSYHLDMLPIFRHLHPDLVTDLIGDTYPASRPAFHYRLPNSGLGQENWSIRSDWNVWVEIEDYASQIGEPEFQSWRQAKGLW